MPIEVRHDVPAGMTAMLAAMAGQATGEEKRRQAQLQRSAAMSQTAARLGRAADMQHESIQARAAAQQQQIEAASAQAHQQAEYAKDQLGLRAGLQEELQDQKFSQEIERMELQARTQAEQFEWKLDVTAKKRQNQHRRELAWLRSPEAREHYEEDEIAFMEGETMRSLLNPQKTPYEPQPDPTDNLVDAEGNPVQLNQSFRNAQGDIGAYEYGSRGQVQWAVRTKYKESEEYLTAQAERDVAVEEAKVRIKELDARRERIEDIREFRYDLSQTKDEDTGKIPGGFEIDRRTLARFGGQAVEEFRGQDLGRTTEAPPAELSVGELEQELQQRVDTVKQAKSFLKKMEKEYKNVENIPPEVLVEIMRADEIVRQVGRR